MVISLVLILSITIVISFVWANAIDKMYDKHPDYKGEDLFDDKKD